jgi:type I restriction enzyme S subunit
MGKSNDTKHTELPSGWMTRELIEIATYVDYRGKTPDKKPAGKFLVTAKNIRNGLIDYEISREYISDGDYNAVMSRGLPKKGDILITTEAPLGSVAMIDREDIALAQRVIKYRTKTDISNYYLYHYLQSDKFQQILDLKSTGSTAKGIKGSILHRLPILLPPLPEQRVIANILSTWDNAIQTTQALISQKEQEKKWLMQNLLTGKKRLNGFSGEWKEFKLSDLFNRVSRKNNEGNTTVVTISAQRGFVRQTDFFNKNIASEVTDNYFLVEKGEFCYNKSYSNGYPWGATKRLKDFDKAVVTTLYICFGVKNEKETNPEFFEQYFNANKLDRGLTKIAHEGGRAHGLLNVTPSDFFSLKVTIPDFEEQTVIAQVLQTADKEIELLKTKLEQQKLQKKGLMQVLLTGKVRVNTINN